MKKILVLKHAWGLHFIQILIPVVFTIMTILIARNTNSYKDLPRLPLSLDSYKNSLTLIQKSTENGYSQNYQEILKNNRMVFTTNITKTVLHLVRFYLFNVLLIY